MIYTIEEIKEKAIPIVIEYDIDRLGLFGSYARGDANNSSDLDFIMDTGGSIGLVQYSKLIHRLEEEFDCHVDLITTACSDKVLLSQAQKEEVLIYEKGG